MPRKSVFRADVVKLANRNEGVGCADFEKEVRDRMLCVCANAVTAGLLFRGKGPKGATRYFTDEKRAKDYEQSMLMATLAPGARVQRIEKRPLSSFSKSAQVVYTPETKVTICPPWKPRFQNIDLPFVLAANQSGRVLGEVES